MKRKLQVFISSTFSDLRDERQAAVSAVLKSGHIPAGMELFTAADQSQMVTITRWIDESDVYMLILGGRYGSIEPTSQLSYTELEYDYAIKSRKPVFAVVAREETIEKKAKDGGLGFVEMQNPKLLNAFRDKVLRNISSFFEDEKDIRLCVHESLSDFAANRDLKGWISADEVTDTKPLIDEIAKLREEISILKSKEPKGRPQSIVSSHADTKVEERRQLVDLLTALKVKIPEKITKGAAVEMSMLDLLYRNKESLIHGVTNAASANESEMFLFSNVMPKLQIHGLAVNEPLPGTKFRRMVVSPLAIDLLAFMDRMLLLKKQDDAKNSSASDQLEVKDIKVISKKTAPRKSTK